MSFVNAENTNHFIEDEKILELKNENNVEFLKMPTNNLLCILEKQNSLL